MPRFTIQISAQLENVSSLTLPPDFPWHVHLRCGNCGDPPPKPVVISESDSVPGVRGGSVGLKITCKLCGRVADLTILPEPRTYTDEQAPEWGGLVGIECRGTEPMRVELPDDVPLTVRGESGFVFEDAFLGEGEFYSYDEKEKVEASVTEFQMQVVRG